MRENVFRGTFDKSDRTISRLLLAVAGLVMMISGKPVVSEV